MTYHLASARPDLIGLPMRVGLLVENYIMILRLVGFYHFGMRTRKAVMFTGDLRFYQI